MGECVCVDGVDAMLNLSRTTNASRTHDDSILVFAGVCVWPVDDRIDLLHARTWICLYAYSCECRNRVINHTYVVCAYWPFVRSQRSEDRETALTKPERSRSKYPFPNDIRSSHPKFDL